jgi:acyl-CoA thioesterase FadM
MRGVGLLTDRWGNFPRRRVEAEYLKVLRFDDEIEVRLRVENVGRTSVTYAWTIATDGEAHVKGRHTVVHVDSEGRPAPLDDALRAALDR